MDPYLEAICRWARDLQRAAEACRNDPRCREYGARLALEQIALEAHYLEQTLRAIDP